MSGQGGGLQASFSARKRSHLTSLRRSDLLEDSARAIKMHCLASHLDIKNSKRERMRQARRYSTSFRGYFSHEATFQGRRRIGRYF